MDDLKTYLSVLEHERHIENRALSTLGHYMTANAFMLVAWATLYDKCRESALGRIGLVMMLLSVAGYFSGLSWAMVGARNWQYVRQLVTSLKTIGSSKDASPALLAVYSPLRSIEDLVHSDWGKKFPLGYHVSLLSGAPLGISVVYLVMFGFILERGWNEVVGPPEWASWLVTAAFGAAGVIGIGVVIERCWRTVK